MAPSKLPQAGDLLGRFTLVKHLGQGGTGTVFEAIEQGSQRRAAVKIILPDVVERIPSMGPRFLREVNIARRIVHPNAVRLFDHGESPEHWLWMAMELVNGEELTKVIKRDGALTPLRAQRLMLQCLDAIAAAHRLKIVHRDLKPSNIMCVYDADGAEHVKVFDFGIGKALGDDEDQKLQDVTGAFGDSQATPHYSPAEVLKGKGVGPFSDVYSLGLILFEMLTGQQAMAADTIFEVYAKQALKAVPLPPWLIDTPLGKIILQATAKAPQERFPDAIAFHEALAALDLSKDPGPGRESAAAPAPKRDIDTNAPTRSLPKNKAPSTPSKPISSPLANPLAAPLTPSSPFAAPIDANASGPLSAPITTLSPEHENSEKRAVIIAWAVFAIVCVACASILASVFL